LPAAVQAAGNLCLFIPVEASFFRIFNRQSLPRTRVSPSFSTLNAIQRKAVTIAGFVFLVSLPLIDSE